VILFVHCFGDFFRKEELEMNVDKGVKQSSHQWHFKAVHKAASKHQSVVIV
jgi:hypothetical protein